jgi:hypothetical protein
LLAAESPSKCYNDFAAVFTSAVAGALALAAILARQHAGIPAMLVPAMPFSHLATAAAVQWSFFLPLEGLSPSWAKAVAAEASRAKASRDFFMGESRNKS